MTLPPKKFQSYSDVEAWLNARPQFSKDGKKATDFRPAKLVDFCAHLDHPERTGNFIHVAGTNGKGTTCAMIASVYQTAGYKTGLFTSPHIEHWRERIKINGRAVSEEAVLAVFQRMEAISGFDQLTYFELGTVAAFLIFNDAHVDLAVIETGMGGRLDATNILIPNVSVITSIGLDHTDYLGNTIEAIAFEKAGIIKPGIPVVVGDLPDAAFDVVRSVAESLNAKLVMATDYAPYVDTETSEIVLQQAPALVRFSSDIPSVTSAINAAMALGVCELLQSTFMVKSSDINMGLAYAARNTGLKGRMERLLPNRNWYYDGAHNDEALQVLLLNLDHLAPKTDWTVVFTMMGDKANANSLETFKGFKSTLFWRSNSDRTADAQIITHHLPEVLVCNEDEIVHYITSLTSEFVIFTGSFYFYNEVRRWIRSVDAF
jgi:dihydrofolate synthase / folylpolyglutamate synthase